MGEETWDLPWRPCRQGFLFALVALCWASDAFADERVTLPEVVVSARRIPGFTLSRSRIPGHITIISAEEIRRSSASTVQEILARVEGVTLLDQQDFGLSSDSTLNLRGIVNSARTNVLVLVDGVRQNRLTGDEVHWQSIPLAAIERIEVLHGGSGLAFGEGALAGVINIVTRQGGARLLETEQRVELGSFGWQQYVTQVQGRADRATYGVTYSRRLVDGYREFSASRNTTLTTHTGLELFPGLAARVNVLHSEDTTGFPGGLTLAQTEQRRRQAGSFRGFNDNDTTQTVLDLITGPWSGWSGSLSAFWRKRTQSSEDSFASNSFTVTPSRGLHLRGNHEWEGESIAHLLVGGLELMDDKATTGVGRNPSFGQADSESHRKGYGFYLEETLTLWDRTSLVAGVRFDKFRYKEAITNPAFVGTLRFEGVSPKLGVTYSILPDHLEAFASYSRPFKAPNVDDFSAQVPSFPGNVDLKPQQADTYDLGTRLTWGPIAAAATWFYTRIDDEILTEPTSLQNQNFDTRRHGLESSIRLTGLSRVRGSMTYAFVDAEFDEGAFEDRTIPSTPEHTFTLSMGVSPVESFWIDLDWQLVQDYFRVNDFRNRLPADNYGVLNLRLQVELPESVTRRGWPSGRAYVVFRNLTNEEYVAFQSSNGTTLAGAGEHPAPPFNVLAGLAIQF